MPLRGIIADQQNSRSTGHVTHSSGAVLLARNSGSEGGVVRGGMGVNVVCSQHRARKLLQQIVLFIRGAVGTNHADGLSALGVADLTQAFAYMFNRFFPRSGLESAVLANQRMAQAVFVVKEIESIAAFDAEKVAINAALVAIIAANNVHAGIGATHAERGLAAVATVRADGADVVHLPRAGLVTVRAGSQRTHRADVNAHAAFFAIQVVALVGRDHGAGAPELHAECGDVHGLSANTHATVAKNATWTVKEDDRRPLLLFFVQLAFHVTRLGRAVLEGHVLQFAFAAGIAYGAIQRMIAQQQLDHRFARLPNFVGIGGHDHSIRDLYGARGL